MISLTQFEYECIEESRELLDALRLKVNLGIINDDVHYVRQNKISNIGYVSFNIKCGYITKTIFWKDYDKLFLEGYNGINNIMHFEEILIIWDLKEYRDQIISIANKLVYQMEMKIPGPNSLDITKDVHIMYFANSLFFYRNNGVHCRCDINEVK